MLSDEPLDRELAPWPSGHGRGTIACQARPCRLVRSPDARRVVDLAARPTHGRTFKNTLACRLEWCLNNGLVDAGCQHLW